MAKFSGFRTINEAKTIEEVIKYLTVDLKFSIRELQTGLLNLNFNDNFNSQLLDVTLPPNSTTGFNHSLGITPSQRIIVKSNGSNFDDSDTPWTSTIVYFRNNTGTSISAKIILLR